MYGDSLLFKNFLFNKKLAITATEGTMHLAIQQKSTQEHRAQQQKDEALVLANQLSKVEITLFVRIGENGKLFGSIASKDVAEELLKQTKIDLDRRKIELKEPVKGLGTYKAVAKIHPEIAAEFTVYIKSQAN